MLAVLLPAVEAGAYLVGRVLAGRGVLYVAPDVSADTFDHDLRERHALLGWAPTPRTAADVDASGARRGVGSACVSAYGDSFTWGTGVPAESAWPTVVGRHLGCHVGNFGVEGYGTDQALLRFEANENDDAPVVILAHLSENILRNVNRWRYLLYRGRDNVVAFKPRFLSSPEGKLHLLPPPVHTAADLRRVSAAPSTYLEHDYFVPGGPAGVGRLRFPYTVSAFGSLWHFHVRARLAGRPWYAEFYDPSHPSGALDVTVQILERFVRSAAARGSRPLVVVLPTGLDLLHRQRDGVWTYAPLVERLRRRGLAPLDIGPRVLSALGDRDPCELFIVCNGHFNEEGNAIVGRIIADHLDAEVEVSNRSRAALGR